VRRAIAVGVCAFSLIGLGAGAASAGEITGNGKKVVRGEKASICSFSGLNDFTEQEPGTKVQSYGQLVRIGLRGELPNPGAACNPNAEPPEEPPAEH
jgi:hypothetical protein